MVNPRTPFGVKREMVRRRFLGYTRDEAAKGHGAAGIATKAMEEFKALAASDGLAAASSEYDIEDLIEDLLRLTKELRDSGNSIEEAGLGLEVVNMLDELGVPKHQQRDFLKAIRTAVA